MGSRVVLRGLVTTPQVHYMVREYNLGRQGLVTEYNTTISGAFSKLMETKGDTPARLIVDCADGRARLCQHGLTGLF